ncbi:transcriptional regulator with XRE-family HTH domain [Kaistia hirudinis]|uniref:Transcriptional regulator with XRE-family HTH domain n=1 Tax=Kaistia hirudinis TaxID=1293440 RepID=A0A840ANR6_9HYPH|nr:helix-turn-helix transcriptional regulator [Kaistia hirudinis]MBB3930056.1 transcriptional regulator with XRE-family HTH domain [Kaistia hirudinis]
MVQLSRGDLARLAGVAERTIADFEGGRRTPIRATLGAIRKALETAGVIFVDENGEGPGVRLRKARHDEGTRPDDLNAGNDD